MKLSEVDRRIICYISLDADLSASHVAQALGLKSETVRRTIQKLSSCGILSRNWVINPAALGLTEFQILISLHSGKEEGARRELIDALGSSQRVSYIAELGGQYQLDVQLLARSVLEVQDFFDELEAQVPHFMLARETLATIETTEFAVRFLGGYDTARESMSFGRQYATTQVDQADQLILQALGASDFGSLSDLARKLSIPKSSLSYRIQALRGNGVIAGHLYVLDAYAVGFSAYKVFVRLGQSGAKARDTMLDFGRSSLHVNYVVQRIGAWDYVVGLKLDDQRELPKILEKLSAAIGDNLLEMNAIPRYDVLKINYFPFTTCTSLA